MKILVINSGSSSIKLAVFDMQANVLCFKKKVERIGEQQGIPDHTVGMAILFEELDQMNLFEIDGVGHRIVHGGEKFAKPTLINKEVFEEIKQIGRFVPLHCTPNLIGITLAQKKFPDLPHVAIFDTSTYTHLNPTTYLYGIPIEFYEQQGLRKYGFHGINHRYVCHQVSQLVQKENLKIISCHLGNGCSITAFKEGRSIDTSMGLTPLEGVVMGSRCGDIDPSVVLYLMDFLGLTTNKMIEWLNKECGLRGLCGYNDMRDIHHQIKGGDPKAQIAIEIFVYRIQKYIGAYIAILKGVDVIVFTGGIGENDFDIRHRIMDNFNYVGAFIEKEKNQRNAPIFSAPDSKVLLMNIVANEELMIAQETQQLICD